MGRGHVAPPARRRTAPASSAPGTPASRSSPRAAGATRAAAPGGRARRARRARPAGIAARDIRACRAVRAAVVHIPAPDQHACAFTLSAGARPPLRPVRLHAAVRPRAGRRPRASGSRRRAPHLALSLRRGARAGRLRAKRALLPLELAGVPALALRLPLKAIEHPLGMSRARTRSRRRRPPAVARVAAAGSRAAPREGAAGVHRPRPAPAPLRG